MSTYAKRVAQLFRLGNEKYFVGKDLEGNSFYERPSPNDPSDWRHSKRTVEYVTARPLSEYQFYSLPVQWNAWMRRTRKGPPSIEELEHDYLRQQSLARNVERLKVEYQAEKVRMLDEGTMPIPSPRENFHADQVPGSTVEKKTIETQPEKHSVSTELESKEGATPATILEEAPSPSNESATAAHQSATNGEREKAMLRRQFAKANARPSKGNPDSQYQPETWNANPLPRPR